MRPGSWIPALALCAGCASTPPGYDVVGNTVTQRSLGGVEWNPQSQADERASQTREMLKGELTAEQAVRVALLNNPSLQATLAELDISWAERRQARIAANPTAHIEWRQPGDPTDPLEIGAEQDISDLFLLPLRSRVATSEFEATKLRVSDAAMNLATDVRVAFYTLQGAEQMHEMLGTITEAARAGADLALRQHAAGNISNLTLENQQALYEQAKLELAESDVTVLEAREHLNQLMGMWGEQTSWAIQADLPELPAAEPVVADLESLAVAQRLDLAAVRQQVGTSAGSIALERYSRWPSVEIGFHYEREPDGAETTGPSLALSLPLFDRGQAGAAGAKARLRKNEEESKALAIQIRSEVRMARARLLAARRVVDYHRDVVLPRRIRIVEHSQREYNFMLIGAYQLLQAKQEEIDATRRYINGQRDYWIAWTELERAVGGQLPR